MKAPPIIACRLSIVAIVIAVSGTGLRTTPLNAAGPRARFLGRKVDNFVLTNAISGSRWKLSDQAAQAAAVVLYFNSTECPVTNRYLPSLNRMHANLAGRDVVFVAINSNQHDTAEDIRKHAIEYDLTVPVLHDAEGEVARSLAVTRTSEALVLDHQLKVRYRGVVDDRFERGMTRPKATKEFLTDAINAVLKGRAVRTSITHVEACPLNLPPKDEDSERCDIVTWSDDAATIIQRRCQACHRPEGIGPFELMTYEDAKSWSASIREVVTQGLMPPWHADAPHGHFLNDRSLTDNEYATLLDWIDDGAAEGDNNRLPKPRTLPDSWSIGTPDLVVQMQKAVEVPAEAPELGVPYKYIWAGKPFERETWVKAAEVHPGATEVVHHASVYIVPEGVTVRLVNDERPGGLLDDLFSPLSELPHLVSFVPGDNAFVYRKGLAVRIPQAARLLFEMHYTPTGKRATDRTEVGLTFADDAPEHEVTSTAAINYWFSIPPGAANHQVKAETTRFKRDSVLLSMNPHMHYRGKSFKYELVEPSGRRSLLLNVPNYNFEWQTTYVLAKPVEIPGGSRILCTATFDNSKDNPLNPDPAVRVEWGEQTWQEMMLGSIEVYEK